MKHRRPKSPSSDRRIELVTIEKPIYGGAFLARAEGKAMFVPLTLPGEEVRVRIVEEKRSYATAEPESIVSAAANRVVPDCPHFGTCGGCTYQHTDYESQLQYKKLILTETLMRGGVDRPEQIDVLAGDPWHYRNRIRLAVDSAGRVGYRERRSHSIVPVHECPIAAPLLAETALTLGELLRSTKLPFVPREISLFCNAEETALLASIFTQGGTRQQLEPFVASLRERVPALRGIQANSWGGDVEMTRTIAEWGDSQLSYRVCGIDYEVAHGAFFQVNRWLLDQFVERVTGGQRGTLAWDLYAGVGLFARQLAAGFDEVIAVESSPASMRTLSTNLEGTNSRCVSLDVAAFLKRKDDGKKPDLIVVDPPRTGLGIDVSSLLARTGPRTIVYVSCDPATLARDLRALLADGYVVSSITLVDLFPQTFHLETVVELQRAC